MSAWPAVVAAVHSANQPPGPPLTPAQLAEAERLTQATIDYFKAMEMEGRCILFARQALGDFDPKPERTFWQWVTGR